MHWFGLSNQRNVLEWKKKVAEKPSATKMYLSIALLLNSGIDFLYIYMYWPVWSDFL